jgi:hypothetical protein
MADSRGGNRQGREILEVPPYAVLTRDISGGISSPGTGGSAGPQSGGLGPVVMKALQDVLGWKVNSGDAKGFVSALDQSFQLTEYEGTVHSKWTPRSYAVQTDLSGGVAGAQASLYTMAKTILDQAMPLLDGLYALKPAPNLERVQVLRQLVRNQLTELVSELGLLGGPRLLRVNQYFRMLLAGPSSVPDSAPPTQDNSPLSPTDLEDVKDPDLVHGTLGELRDEMGLRSKRLDHHRSYIISVSDEQDVTNFRVILDYVNAILNTWIQNLHFFVNVEQSPFLGTQLVWISRQLGVVGEAVDEVRFVLDSVFVGPAERQTIQVHDPHDPVLPAIPLESLLSWIQLFTTNEGPDIIQNGGRLAIRKDFKPMVRQLHRYADALVKFAKDEHTGLGTERVGAALRKLRQQLFRLGKTAERPEKPLLTEPVRAPRSRISRRS